MHQETSDERNRGWAREYYSSIFIRRTHVCVCVCVCVCARGSQ